jgi:hypothetical protein
MSNEQDTTTKRRYQRAPQRRQAQPDDHGQERQQNGRREDETGEQPSLSSFVDTELDTESEVDLQGAPREELEAMAFELDIEGFESMDREELLSEIEDRS